MEISRYASRLAPGSHVLPSGRPLPRAATQPTSPDGETGALPLALPQCLPEEPDDAKLTGGTRSLSRRLLALNIPGQPAAAALQAADGARVAGANVRPKSKLGKARKVLAKPSLVPQDA
jgi:hypothetical protein